MRKNLLFIWIPIVLIAVGIGMVLASCNNTSIGVEQLPKTGFKQPVTVPLIFSKPKKINWDAIKATRVKPVVKKFDIAKLPVQSYDNTGFKPFVYGIEETKFDYNSLPEKDFDIDKIPSKPLKFKTYILPPPRLIKSGSPRLKDTSLSLYEFGETQGLQGALVSCLFNDNEGFLWIATDKGIYRYDGENPVLYIPVVAGSFILNMLQDHAGRIWITVANEGLEIFDPVAGTLKKTNMALGLLSNNPFAIIEDKQQRIWISGGDNGHSEINIIDPKMQTVKLLDAMYGLSDSKLSTGISQDMNNNIWIASWKGLNIIDLENKKIKYLDKAHGLASDIVDRLQIDREGNLWIGLHDGLINFLNFKKGTLQFIKEAKSPGSVITSLMRDNKGRIWAATAPNNGLEIIDQGKHLASNLKTNNGLAGNFVFNIKQDIRGQVWIATTSGLSMIADKKAVIEHIGKTPTTTLIEDGNGLIWQGSLYNGVNIFDRKTKTFKHLSTLQGLGNDTMPVIRQINSRIFITTGKSLEIIDSSRNTITHISKKHGLGIDVRSLTMDREGKLWMGEEDNGIDVYDPKNNTFKHLGKLEGLSDNDPQDVTLDQRGRIWVSTYTGGIDVIDPQTSTIQYLNNEPFKVTDQRFLLLDSLGNMWISTKAGIYIADVKNQTLTSFSTPQGLIDEGVISLLKHNNQIYAGTTKGVSVITPPKWGISDKKNWKVESFGKFYVPNKLVQAANNDLVTKDGLYFWGDEGITVLDLSKKDHFISRLYITGINILDGPKYFTGRGQTISNGETWNKVTGPNNMPVNLQLPYNQNYIQFNYANLNLANHDTTWYSYRLSGTDKNWSNETISTSSRNYFSMAPGKYTFEVVSRSSYSGWGKPAILSFTINPPWWQTWWAYILYVILFGGTIWGFSHYRSLQLIKDKRALEHKVHIRTEEVVQQKEEIESQRDNLEVQRNNLERTLAELKSTQTQLIQSEKMASLGELTAGIAHEIQNPLNFVNNFSEVNQEMLDELDDELNNGNIAEAKAIAADIRQNEEKINHHGKRADSIVKGMLEHSRSRSGQKEPTDINTIADEFIRLSYQGLRSKDKSFNAGLTTNFDPRLPKINVVQQDIGRVLLNLFNNAFYAVNQKQKTVGPDYKPEVSVNTSSENGQVIIKVKDNGTGIPDAIKDKIMQPFFTTKPTGEGTGLGLSLTYDMVVKGHGGSISVDTKEGGFSIFTIQLPIG